MLKQTLNLDHNGQARETERRDRKKRKEEETDSKTGEAKVSLE